MGAPIRPRQAGFTYLGLVIFVFILGMVGAATLKIGSLLQRAHAEQELLEIGFQFSAALKSYADATPRGQPPQPMSLQELLRDTRFPTPRRHLRKIFVDPVGGKAEWGLVRAGEGGRILGVHSLSQAAPLKLGNFDKRFPGFENREHIADWKFMAEGGSAGAPQAPPASRVPVAPGVVPSVPAPAPPGTAAPAEPPSAPREPPSAPPAEPPAEPPSEPPPEPEQPEREEPEAPAAPVQGPPGQAQDAGR